MDPVTGGAAKKAAEGVVDDVTKLRPLTRVLGPSLDVIGEALGRYTEQRVANVGRIAEVADRKSRDREGSVPARVAHRLLEDGSYCDDELMAEYLGGVLAASKTPDGRDDRAVVWTDLVSKLSVLQLRGHFVLYREWAAALHDRDDLNLGAHDRRRAQINVEVGDFVAALTAGSDWSLSEDEVMGHVLGGFWRHQLVEDELSSGQVDDGRYAEEMRAMPSVPGLELYGWAQGTSGMTPSSFPSAAQIFGGDEVPRLTTAYFPSLGTPDESVGSPDEPNDAV